MKYVPALVALSCLSVSAIAGGDKLPIQFQRHLAGIEAVQLWFEKPQPNLSELGLNVDRMRVPIELALRSAGISVRTETPYRDALERIQNWDASTPKLHILVQGIEVRDHMACVVKMELLESALLKRLPFDSATAVTWENGVLFLGPRDQSLVTSVAEHLHEISKNFANTVEAARTLRPDDLGVDAPGEEMLSCWRLGMSGHLRFQTWVSWLEGLLRSALSESEIRLIHDAWLVAFTTFGYQLLDMHNQAEVDAFVACAKEIREAAIARVLKSSVDK